MVGFILRAEMRRARVKVVANVVPLVSCADDLYVEAWCPYCASRMLPEWYDRRHKHTLGLGG